MSDFYGERNDVESAEVAELEAAVPEEEIVGDRYAAANMASIDQ